VLPVDWRTWPGKGRSSPQAGGRRAAPAAAEVALVTRKRAGLRRVWGLQLDRRTGVGGVLQGGVKH